MIVYYHLWKEHRGYEEEKGKGLRADNPSTLANTFKVSTFRVLFVTKSKDRMANMIALCQNKDILPHAQKLFWFSVHDAISLDNPECIFDPVWYNGATQLDERGRIIGPPEALIEFPRV